MDNIIEQFNRNSRNAWQSLRRLGDINGEIVRRFTEVQFNAINLGIEGSAEQVKLVVANPGHNDYATAQADFGNRYGSKMVGLLREVSDIANDSREEALNWFEGCVSDAQEGASAAVQQAKDMVKTGN